MKIKSRLYFSAAIVSLLVGVLITALLVSAYHIRDRETEYRLFEDLQIGLSDLNIVLNEYVLYRERRMEDQWQAKYAATARELERLKRKAGGPSLKLIFADYAAMGDLFAQLRTRYRSGLRSLRRDNLQDEGERRLVSRLLASSQRIKSNLSHLVTAAQSGWHEAQQLSVKIVSWFSFMVVLIASVVIGVFIFFIGRTTRSFSKLIEGARSIGGGDLSHRIDIRSSDELASLATAFNGMAQELESTTVSRDSLQTEIAERLRAEEALKRQKGLLSLLHRLAVSINGATSVPDALTASLKEIGTFMDWPVGRACLRQDLPPELGGGRSYLYFKEEERFAKFAQSLGAHDHFKSLADMKVFEVSRENPQSPSAGASGLVSGFGFFVGIGCLRVAYLQFYSMVPIVADSGLRETLGQAASLLGRAFEKFLSAKELSDSEQRFRSLSDAALEGVVIHENGRIVEVNSAVTSITGYSTEELLGSEVTRYVPEALHDLVRESIVSDTDRRYELVIVRKNGVELLVEVHAKKIPLEGRTGRVVVLRDITQRKESEAAVRDSEARFRRLSEAAFEAVLIHKDLAVVEVNDAFLKMFGYSDAVQVIGSPILEMVAPEFRDLAREKVKTGDESSYEMEMFRRDRRRVVIEVRGRAIPYGGGMARVATLNDITERKRSEELLREREATLRVLVEQMPAILWSTDTELRYTSSVGAGLYRLNLRANELVGLTVFDHFRSSNSDFASIDAHRRALQGESLTFEVVWSGRTFEAHVEPLRNKEGRITGTIGVALDITERKFSEEQLKCTAAELTRSNRELEQFAYVASHDLQEPLRMIASYIDLLSRRYATVLDADAQEFIGYAVDGAKRMKQQIDDLLAYSRVDRRGRCFSRVSCREVVDRAMMNLRLAISEAEARVHVGELPEVSGDPVQLGQLFQNLISNALKFRSRAVPKIDIYTERVGEEWIFSVEDNGIGIEMEYAERIFLIFQRLHTVSEYPGTGIGLAICKKIVERHGGRIWVECLHNPHRRHGSIFRFTLPILMSEESTLERTEIA